MTQRVFVANRGEIAVRIIEACDRLGYETVLGVSLADRTSLAARRAGRVVVLGGPQSRDSYLSVDAVLHAAVETGCTALHPGYGFLSERSDLARGCADNDIVFVGPSPEALEALGDKLSARALAEKLDVPVSAGGTAESWDDVSALAEQIGYPVLVKAAYGGGGRGMKLVHTAADLAEAWSVASSEAAAAFGDGTVFLERYLTSAKHIEVQILGDRHGNRIHLGERECSVQYRYQKVVEESPSTSIDAATREVMTTSALKIAAELDYVGLGTVEFLYDVHNGEVAFLEVNPRLQVEHPVTEQVTGVDLVRQQLLAALGEPIEITQADAVPDGHALEVRITAQDPDRGLAPTPAAANGAGRRVLRSAGRLRSVAGPQGRCVGARSGRQVPAGRTARRTEPPAAGRPTDRSCQRCTARTPRWHPNPHTRPASPTEGCPTLSADHAPRPRRQTACRSRKLPENREFSAPEPRGSERADRPARWPRR